MKKKAIPVAAPTLNGNERKYVLDCLQSTWISSNGPFIERFERRFAKFCDAKYAATCCNGTVAIHLALLALGIGSGDEVIVPTITFVATANAVTYCGARPVFVDVDPHTWNMDCTLVEASITKHTKAIIAVHLYGHPADMDAIRTVADRYGLAVVEDAAEAHGALYKGRPVGAIGDVGTFSFYGNKILTTGEGGMVVTNNKALAQRVRLLKGQGMDPHRRYWFPVIGFNYRMTNIAAAIGLAQLEKVASHTKQRQRLAGWYRAMLEGVPGIQFQAVAPYAKPIYWMVSVVLGENITRSRDEVMTRLKRDGIETRPIFYPMHVLPPYRKHVAERTFPVSERIAARGISLPTWSGVVERDAEYIAKSVIRAVGQ